MTPEQELELLINEQQKDDTYYVDRPSGEISLDAPTPDGVATMGDLVGIDDEGEITVFFRPPPGALFENQGPQHGTIYAYRRLRCRCVKCKKAQSTAVAEYRARRKTES